MTVNTGVTNGGGTTIPGIDIGGSNPPVPPPGGTSISLTATDIPLVGTVDVTASVNLTPVINTVTGIVSGAGDVVGTVLGGLTGTPAGQSPQDTDLTIAAQLLDVPVVGDLGAAAAVTLDPVEALLGRDIDINVGAVANLAPVTGALNGVTDSVGTVLGGLTGTPAGQSPQNTDLTIAAQLLNVPVVGELSAAAAVTLDPVEALLGRDIDIDVGAVVNAAPVTGALNGVADSVGTVLGGLTGTPAGQSPQDTDLTIAAQLLDVPVVGDLSAAAAVTLDPVEALLGRDIDIDVGAVVNAAPVTGALNGVTDSVGTVLGGLTGTPAGQSPQDTDLTIAAQLLNVPVVGDLGAAAAVTLDPVEALLGRDIDIDIDVGAVANLAPVTGALNGVTDSVGTVLGGLTGTPAGQSPQDTDLTIAAQLLNVPVVGDLGAAAAVTLDPVEALLGRDIDIDVGAVANLAPVTGALNGVTDSVGTVLGGLTGTPAGQSPQDTDLTIAAQLLNVPVVGDLGAAAAVTLDPVESLLGRDIDIDVGAVVNAAPVTGALNGVADSVGTVLGGLTGTPAGHATKDTDLTIGAQLLNVPVVGTAGAAAAVTLDPVESLLGRDIDIDVGAVANLAPVTGVLNGVADSVGTVLGGLTGTPAGHAPQDTDLTVGAQLLNVPVVGTAGAATAVTLDPVESLLGRDIDIDVSTVANLDVLSTSSGSIVPSVAVNDSLLAPVSSVPVASVPTAAISPLDLVASHPAASDIVVGSSSSAPANDLLSQIVGGATATLTSIDHQVASSASMLSTSLSTELTTLNGGNYSISGLADIAPTVTVASGTGELFSSSSIASADFFTNTIGLALSPSVVPTTSTSSLLSSAQDPTSMLPTLAAPATSTSTLLPASGEPTVSVLPSVDPLPLVTSVSSTSSLLSFTTSTTSGLLDAAAPLASTTSLLAPTASSASLLQPSSDVTSSLASISSPLSSLTSTTNLLPTSSAPEASTASLLAPTMSSVSTLSSASGGTATSLSTLTSSLLPSSTSITSPSVSSTTSSTTTAVSTSSIASTTSLLAPTASLSTTSPSVTPATTTSTLLLSPTTSTSTTPTSSFSTTSATTSLLSTTSTTHAATTGTVTPTPTPTGTSTSLLTAVTAKTVSSIGLHL
ncbi:hypothetical protein [Bradyrhizobium sp. ORS 285]|uniref:beta strand repeat-containing protein n=1 Tax=Bradyrhizobium sp. ORS 285 TaxID=115808 RepID=UPI0012F96B44|nr:hypothetical protein [Bradyrhizobium sp. ORS 285]